VQSPSPSSARHYVVKRINQYSVSFQNALTPRPPLISPRRVPMTSCRELASPANPEASATWRRGARPRRFAAEIARPDHKEYVGRGGGSGFHPLDSSGRGWFAAQLGADQRLQPPSFPIASVRSPLGLSPRSAPLPSCAYPPLLPPWFTRTYELLSL